MCTWLHNFDEPAARVAIADRNSAANVPQIAQGDAIRAAGGRAAAFEAQYTSILCS